MTLEIAGSNKLIGFISEISKVFSGYKTNITDSDECQRLCENFLKSTSTATIYVVQIDASIQLVEYLKESENYTKIIALIKSNDPIVSTKSFDSQLHILNIPIELGNPQDQTFSSLTSDSKNQELSSSRKFEVIRSLINLGVSPYFELISSNQQNDSISMVRKKFNELSLTLQHLQQKIHIPDLISTTHPIILEHSASDISIEEIIDSIPVETLQDTSFLNQLTTIVNGWVKQIQLITKLNHSPSSGKSIVEEILFWKSMDESLNSLNLQISRKEIQTTIEILKRAKRYHITISFTNETGLEDKLSETIINNSILKDLPIDSLLSSDILTLKDNINLIFNHLKKLKNLSSYPLLRSIELIEVIINDITSKFIDIISSSIFLMSLPINQFLNYFDENLNDIFQIIELNIKSMVNLIRELLRKRQEKFIIIKINQDNLKFWKESLDNLKAFRIRHDNIIKTCEILGKSDERLIEAYNQYIIPINVCDMSIGGKNIWKFNESLYLTVLEEVKKVILVEINDLFESCDNFNEYLNVFNRLKGGTYFSSGENDHLMESTDRNFILSFISEEHKLKCMHEVDTEIQNLIHRNRKNTSTIISSLKEYRGSITYDVSDIVERVIWLNSIQKSVNFYQHNLESLFGDKWDQYSIGGNISNGLKSLLKVGNPEDVVKEWVERVNYEIDLDSSIFSVNRGEDERNYLTINFDLSNIYLFDQLMILSNLGFKVPIALNAKLQAVGKLQPMIKDLSDCTNILNDILNRELTLHTPYGTKYKFLVLSQISLVFEFIKRCNNITWNIISLALDLQNVENQSSQDLSNLIEAKSLKNLKTFLEQVHILYGKVNSIREFFYALQTKLKSLEVDSKYDQKVISSKLSEISDLVSKTSLEDFDQLDVLYYIVNTEIENVLRKKCIKELKIFKQSIRSEGVMSLFADNFTISLSFKDQILSFDPEINLCKKAWFNGINKIILTVSNNEQIFYDEEKKFTSIPDSISEEILSCYEEIESVVMDATVYLREWENIQFQWLHSPQELETEFNKINENINLSLWINKIQEIRNYREVFDTGHTLKVISQVLTIDYSSTQLRIYSKFETWQNDVLSFFGEKVNLLMKDMNTNLSKAIQSLIQPFDYSSTSKIIQAILDTNKSINDSETIWTTNILEFEAGQRALARLRYKFPDSWLHIEQLESNISEVKTLISRKTSAIQDHMELIQPRLTLEAKRIEEAIKQLNNSWQKKKPISGDLLPVNAIKILHGFEDTCEKLESERKSLLLACSYIDLHIILDEYIETTFDEVKDLLSVWLSLDGLWEEVSTLRSINWNSITSTRNLRLKLDDLLATTRTLPTKTRQYAAFNTIQALIKSHIRNHSIITELRGPAMKPRHWKMLSNNLLVKNELNMETLTIGQIWDMDLSLNDHFIKTVLNQAQMELTLEENILSIKESWNTITFELFNYQNSKHHLIRNWDKLFDQCNNDLSSLSNMKNSTFYFNFEKEALDLEGKLTKFYLLMDTWVDVQREWVYLDGVFGGSKGDTSDIASLLPLEYSRFNNLSHEYFTILRKAYKFPIAIEVLSIQDIQKIMDRTYESLNKVRRSLSDYLEHQRELFPRFYFIGNEDLLQIIGSGNSTTDKMANVNLSIKKMFTGISSLEYSPDSACITGVFGDYNELVSLSSPVSLIKYPKLNEWLSKLETEIRLTLSSITGEAIEKLELLLSSNVEPVNASELLKILDRFSSQVLTVSLQVLFTRFVEVAIAVDNYSTLLEKILRVLEILSTNIILEITPLQRKKYEILTIEFLHMRDIVCLLIESSHSPTSIDCIWNIQQTFYFNIAEKDPLLRLKIKQANVEFYYGFEYLGIPDKLAFTPLTNKCFLAMTQALGQKLGGSPFGPAGTGKTESLKALGNNLGKMVLVFCCDESFDFQSMGRIFLGICKVGCWVCFDEFNRLDGNILSAVSSQIESIETGLRTNSREIDLSNRNLTVHPETGVFITLNPSYAGRSELPENLKKLFRSVSMESPNMDVIIEVLLTSNGFTEAKKLATIIVPLFLDILQQTSDKSHYDFGLRALKSTLVRCGNLRRSSNSSTINTEKDKYHVECKIVLRSIKETINPKLVLEDKLIVNNLLELYFPGVFYDDTDFKLIELLRKNGEFEGLATSDVWIEKLLQIYRIQNTNHGLMLVGNSGSGKSTAWRLLMKSLQEFDGIENVSYIIDCKVMLKDKLYGSLDSITREWVDGLLTGILRKVTNNFRGELSKRIWIVFDGDIDPEWAENLNSVLDDNKILTLPNGERIVLPENVRIIFETDSLKSTTPATISRCGMIWFDESIVSLSALNDSFIAKFMKTSASKEFGSVIKKVLTIEVLTDIISETAKLDHIMKFSIHRCLETLFTMLSAYHKQYISVDEIVDILKYSVKSLVLSLIWSFTGDCSIEAREAFGKFISQFDCFIGIEPIAEGTSYIDYNVSLDADASWLHWLKKVEYISLEPHQVSDANTVVPTLDTVCHESLIYSMLNEHRPFLLCGPPGSGKTMILLEALRKSPDLDIISLNFSKDTTPELLMKSLHQFCEYKKTSGNKLVLAPKVNGKWVVVFCDEINLPGYDKYGTQTVISLLRQMIEQGGFWGMSDQQWVTLSNVQFVGACNPPTDAGRNELPERFLRHCSLVMVGYPGGLSLKQIYQTYNLAVMKCAPDLRGFSQNITDAMIAVYSQTKKKLTPEMQIHYIYSPRELTRWSKGLLEAAKSHKYESLNEFVRLWYHEGLRLFFDRLVGDDEKSWTLNLFKDTLTETFPHIEVDEIIGSPILFSNWLSLDYEYVTNTRELISFVNERLRVFSEEEIDVDLVLFDDLLDSALRIDRVLRQQQGHMILVGPSTSGKTTLSRFVAWLNGLKIVQLNVYSGYTLNDFDTTLRSILIRCASGERVCFMIDESSVLEASFIERMNTLLANAEIPGLFEDDNLQSLMKLCQSELQVQGLYLDTDDELYMWFTEQVAKNLHVIFTISDTTISSTNKPKITTSPALFNRCVLSWMGDWSNDSLYSIALSLISSVPLDSPNYAIPFTFESVTDDSKISDLRGVLVDTLVYIHRHAKSALPSSFMKLAKMFIKLFNDNLLDLEDNQRHINNGLDKLKETVLQVNELKIVLSKKNEILQQKDQDAKKMLNRMLTDQNEAERKQEFSIETQGELNKQQHEIERRRLKVMKDLEVAEPAVLEARKGVQNIKKQHLTEIRSMANPPNGVKLTMESVCILLGYDVQSWRDVQLVVRRDDFITNIVSFNNEEQLTPELRDYMVSTYISRSDYNFEAANRASKACGPLLQWVEAQLTYSTILERIGPLREEMLALERSTQKTKAQLIAIDQMIKELEESIEGYKEDYSQLIRDAENVKSDMSKVTQKVERSLKLISSLTAERERWQSSIKKFTLERELLVGNTLLAAAFATYAGEFDEKARECMVLNWQSRLNKCGIKFNSMLSFSQILSTSKEVFELQNNGNYNELDDLNIENFALMKSSNIPFIIDPPKNVVGLLSDWVLKISRKKLIVTSFLNSKFIQQLENALRFGGIILIQDSEYYNPILNAVLRGETYKNGGRFVIKLRDQEIDFSPEFKLYLHTRDPLVDISQFVLGRTSIINFTVTSSSLENQILNITLNNKRPDIEEKRKETIMLQGEYKVKLHSLEKELLTSLSNDEEGKGFKNILDDDSVIGTLEILKEESNQIDRKFEESKKIFLIVDEVRNAFYEVAKHSSLIFRALKSLNELDDFYRFSLASFIEIFKFVLTKSGTKQDLITELYKETFARISLALKKADKVIFALCLLYVYKSLDDGERYCDCFNLIMKAIPKGDNIKETLRDIYKLNLVEDHSQIESVLKENPDNTSLTSLSELLRCLELHEDSNESVESYGVAFANSTSFLFSGIGNYSSSYDFSLLVMASSNSTVLLVSPEDYDPSFKVHQLAHGKKSIIAISMGSKEGVEKANKEISNAMVKGTWVLIQNVHLSLDWLHQLESLDGGAHHPDFKLFLTCTDSAKSVPPTLINKSLLVMFDNRLELQTRMLELYDTIPSEVILSNPVERKHLYFLLIWFHSVILERLKYIPVSFTKVYDFTISDFKSSCFVIENVLLQFGSLKTNISPEIIPWETIRYMIADINYGGKVDNPEDYKKIIEFSKKIFRKESFSLGFNLIDNQYTNAKKEKLTPPEGGVSSNSIDVYKKWISTLLPEQTSLNWIELDQSADIVVREEQTKQIAKTVSGITTHI